MFRITISDAFGHVISRLQKIVTDETKTSPAVLPKNVTLEDITKKVTNDLKMKTDSIYSEKELTVVVTFDVEENGDINLLGVTKRYWESPTLSYEEALQFGVSYKCFHLPVAKSVTPSLKLKEKFGNVVEILSIPISNLQKKTKPDYEGANAPEYLWMNYIMKLPPPYDKRVNLPQWMSQRSVERACDTVVQTRKLVKLAGNDGWNFRPKRVPPLEVEEDLTSKTPNAKKNLTITNFSLIM